MTDIVAKPKETKYDFMHEHSFFPYSGALRLEKVFVCAQGGRVVIHSIVFWKKKVN